MSYSKPIVIVEESPSARRALAGFLDQYGLSGAVTVMAGDEFQAAAGATARVLWLGTDKSGQMLGARYLPKPVRLGAVLDVIAALVKKQAQAAEEAILSFGPYRLDPAQNILIGGDGSEIRLTEKEKEILIVLYRQPDCVMEREKLLHAVWGYGEGIETHTLETHIYRLRQKIEADPAVPKILITYSEGYGLAL